MLHISRQSGRFGAARVGLTQIGVSERFSLRHLSQPRGAIVVGSSWNCSFNGRHYFKCTRQFLISSSQHPQYC